MKYKIALHRSEEGITVSVPALPGYWSEGDTEEEALANIQDAIREYGRPEYDHWLKQFPHTQSLEAKAQVEAFRIWDQQVGAQKTK